MNIANNASMLLKQIIGIVYSPFNMLLILAVTSQLASMLAKCAISFFKTRKFSFKIMGSYGGMPSSHTVFITSLIFGIGLDPKFGWLHPLLTFAIIISAIVLIDTIRFRGAVDQLSDILKRVVEKDESLKNSIKFPKHIAHTTSEVIGGIVFSFIYTFVFYLFFYQLFPH